MSYPQPIASTYCTNSGNFFPLTTPLVSPGDIYESDQSGHAFCIGPNSDIANVIVAVEDDQITPTQMRFTAISPQRPSVGFLATRPDTTYNPSGTPAKILFWSDDIYDPNWRPPGFDPDADNITFVPPQLEVYQYFQPTTPPPGRVDKSYLFQDYDLSATLYIVVPFYGRKYAYCQFTNSNTVEGNTYGIMGVNFTITKNGSANPYRQITVIRAPAVVNGGGTTVTNIITATNQGMFDALVFSLDNAGPAPLRIRVSDNI